MSAVPPDSAGFVDSVAGVSEHFPKIVALTADGLDVFVVLWIRIGAWPYNRVG